MAKRFFRSALFAAAAIAAVLTVGFITAKGIEILVWSLATHGPVPTALVATFLVLLILFMCIDELH